MPRKRKHRHWTSEEEELLCKLFPSTPTHKVAKRLNMSEGRVNNKAYALGLKKSEDYMNSPASGRLRPGHCQGGATRFKKGQPAWNKGKSFRAGGRSAETQFKPGQRGSNFVPIGSHRITKDGYMQRKISDTGYPPRDWRGVHILLWEVVNGRELPKGHAVVFRDGDKRNIRYSNLELITRAELMRRNTIHRYPPELKQTIRTVATLKRKIREAEDEKQD